MLTQTESSHQLPSAPAGLGCSFLLAGPPSPGLSFHREGFILSTTSCGKHPAKVSSALKIKMTDPTPLLLDLMVAMINCHYPVHDMKRILRENLGSVEKSAVIDWQCLPWAQDGGILACVFHAIIPAPCNVQNHSYSWGLEFLDTSPLVHTNPLNPTPGKDCTG